MGLASGFGLVRGEAIEVVARARMATKMKFFILMLGLGVTSSEGGLRVE